MAALGDRFRAAREARGLSLSEVAEQIRIRSVYLSAIEDENWAAIGAAVYVRGFLRTYARFLGLDPEEVVAKFRGVVEPFEGQNTENDDQSAPATVRGHPRSRNLSPFIWIASLVAVVLIAFVVYLVLTPQKPPTLIAASAVLASASPLATASINPLTTASTSPLESTSPGADMSPTQPPSPGAGGPASLQVVVSAPSWLRVTVDGSVSMEGMFPAGTTRVFHGKAVRLRVGNAGGVTIYVDGKSIGMLGKSGAVIDRTFTL